MSQKLIKVGSSTAITISKTFLDFMGVSAGDRVTVKEAGGRNLLVSPAPNPDEKDTDEKIAKLTMDFINRYRKDLEKLAEK